MMLRAAMIFSVLIAAGQSPALGGQGHAEVFALVVANNHSLDRSVPRLR